MIKRVITFTSIGKISKEDFEYAKKVCRAENCYVNLSIGTFSQQLITEDKTWEDFKTNIPPQMIKER